MKSPRRTGFALLLLALMPALAAATASGGQKPLPPRVLVDFENATAVRLEPSQATAAIVAHGAAGNHALKITTDGAANWPSVQIVPRARPWDVSGYEALEMDVVNPQDFSVRVLLQMNNPGADGTHHCNVESATIKARGTGKVTLPFGNWHGSTGHDLDLKNIVSLSVLLDRAGKAHTFYVDNIRAVRLDAAGLESLRGDAFFNEMKHTFGRGINFGNALEAPKEGDWGVTLKAEYFARIRKAGFDNVRIPVRWSGHAQESAPYTIDPKFFARVDWAVREALKNHLAPIVNMHHYEEIFRDPDGHRRRFLEMWRQIAEHYRDFPPELALELLNEPNGKLDADHWNPMLAEAIRVVRQSNPRRLLVVGPTDWNSLNDLNQLELPESDRRIVVTIHYYSPMQFTHQGATWVGAESQQWLGTRWNGTPSERKAILRDFDKAIRWAVEHRRPLYLGEFGSFNRADMDSRARWTRFVAQAAWERKMGFSYWEFCSGFGAYNSRNDTWIGPLKEALTGWKESD